MPLRAERAAAFLRNSQFDLAHLHRQIAPVVAGTVPLTRPRPLALARRSQKLRHLTLQHLVERLLHQPPHKLLIVRQMMACRLLRGIVRIIFPNHFLLLFDKLCHE